MQSDPIGLAGGRNLYAYSKQSPIVLIDVLGLDVRCPIGQSASPAPGNEGRFPTLFVCRPDPNAPTTPQCPFGECAGFPASYNSNCSLQCQEGPLAACLAIVGGGAASSCRRCPSTRGVDLKSCISCAGRLSKSKECFDKYCGIEDCCD